MSFVLAVACGRLCANITDNNFGTLQRHQQRLTAPNASATPG